MTRPTPPDPESAPGPGSAPDATVRRVSAAERVEGALRVPGDKSIGHRSLMFAALAEGTSHIGGLPAGGDVLSTRALIERVGIDTRDEGERICVRGRGWHAWDRPDSSEALELDCGNSGTTARLISGILAGRRGAFRLIGDASLSSRPMGRIVEPLARLGAHVDGSTLPLRIEGRPLHAVDIETPVPSAQVKSCLILAALQAKGTSVVREARPTRDHTEIMLGRMGAPIERLDHGAVRIGGGCPALQPGDWRVPGDPSSAAFWVGLACASRAGEIVLNDVLLNPRRTGFLRVLSRMGADVNWSESGQGIEASGRIVARGSALQGTQVDAHDVVDSIDELPLLAVVATQAQGRTTIRDAAELRVKETDRLQATADLLAAFGASVELFEDGLTVEGPIALKAADVTVPHDHRMAMCAGIAASLADGESTIRGAAWADVSYPGFFDELAALQRA